MLELLFLLIALFLIAVGSYYAALYIVKLWGGHSDEEAAEIVNNFVNGTTDDNPPIETEIMDRAEFNVCKIIGPLRYSEHCELANSDINPPLISTGCRSGLSVLNVCVFYADKSEKRRLETAITKGVVDCLKKRKKDSRVLTGWGMREDLAIPCLVVGYAKTKRQSEILDIELANRRKKIIAKNTAVCSQK